MNSSGTENFKYHLMKATLQLVPTNSNSETTSWTFYHQHIFLKSYIW